MNTLRGKTTKKLNEQQINVLQGLVEKARNMSFDEMQETIWELTYRPKMTAQKLGFSEEISEQEIKVIRAELVNQYREDHPEWAYGRAKAVDNATSALWRALGGDQYAYNTIMERLKEFSYFEDERILKVNRCLNSNFEKSRFGGLRELNFSYEEASFFLEVASEIGQVFANMMAEVLKRYEKEKNDEESCQVTFNEQEKVREKKGGSNEKVKLDSDAVGEKEKGIDPMTLLIKREEFEAFYKAYDAVKSNPQYEWLIANRQKVEEFYKLCGEFKR